MTARKLILEELRRAKREGKNLGSAPETHSEPYGWVSAWHFASACKILRYGARIYELRQAGWDIETYEEHVIDDDGKQTVHAFYRLLWEPGEERTLFPQAPGTNTAIGRR
jgi:helix-turn-helix protein